MRRGRVARPLAERFAEKYEPCLVTGCWLWTDAPNSTGYGRLLVNGAVIGAHRISYELHNGPIPAGLCVCHRCDTPPCVNPAHLFLGTAKDNSDDKYAKGRNRVGIPNPPRGEAQGSARLTAEIVSELRLACHAGRDLDRSALAECLGVSQGTLSRAIAGRTWTHVEAPPFRWYVHHSVEGRLGELEEPDAELEPGPPNLDLFEEVGP